MKKYFIVAEIGLNHLGKKDILKKYIKILNQSSVDAVTIQLLKKNFFIKNKIPSYYIDRNFLLNFVIKNSKKKIGLIVDEIDNLIINKLNSIYFFKILGSQFKNKNLTRKILKLNKKVYISNRGLNKNENSKLMKIIKLRKNYNIIHTQKNKSRSFTDLNKLILYRKVFGEKKLGFGLHCSDHRALYEFVLYKPSSIFFYVKGDRFKKKYLDDEHSIELNNTDLVVRNLKFLYKNLEKLKVI